MGRTAGRHVSAPGGHTAAGAAGARCARCDRRHGERGPGHIAGARLGGAVAGEDLRREDPAAGDYALPSYRRAVDAVLPATPADIGPDRLRSRAPDRTRSEEHPSELQPLMRIPY